jgi:hypothetical protein
MIKGYLFDPQYPQKYVRVAKPRLHKNGPSFERGRNLGQKKS